MGAKGRAKDVADGLQRLYDSEINFSISTFWDGGFYARLGDELNGFRAETTADTFSEAATFIFDMAMIHYPESRFAKTWL